MQNVTLSPESRNEPRMNSYALKILSYSLMREREREKQFLLPKKKNNFLNFAGSELEMLLQAVFSGSSVCSGEWS